MEPLPAGSVTVALRCGDADLVRMVSEVVAWWGAQLIVRPPGAAPPPGDVHVDAVGEQGGAADAVSWAGAGAILVARSPVSGAIVLPQGADELADALAARLAAGQVRRVGVSGSRGGAGASITAALLARTAAAAGCPVALVDLVGGLEGVLALEDEPGPRWADLAVESAPYVGSQLAGVLPTWHGVRVLAVDARGGPVEPERPGLVEVVLGALAQSCRLLVIDLGRHATVRCDDVVVVTTAEAAAVSGLPAALQRAGSARRHLLVRHHPGIAVDAQEVAAVCGMPGALALPHSRTLTGDLARGLTPGDRGRARLTRAARRVGAELNLW